MISGGTAALCAVLALDDAGSATAANVAAAEAAATAAAEASLSLRALALEKSISKVPFVEQYVGAARARVRARAPFAVGPASARDRDAAAGSRRRYVFIGRLLSARPSATSSGAATSTRQQAAKRGGCRPSIAISGGVSARHFSLASEQRGANRQPTVVVLAVDARRRTLPRSRSSCAPRRSGSGAAARSSCVWGCAGRWVTPSESPRSTIWPAYITSVSWAK